MPSLREKILPELILLEPGPERQRMLAYAIHGPRTRIAAFLLAVVATGLTVLCDKLIRSIPSTWSLLIIIFLFLIGFGMVMWYTRQDIRLRLRTQLAQTGIPICIPCGYNLTGNESGVCPECGTAIAK